MPSNLFDLQNEIAVVLGGTGALGGAMADALAAHGAKVAVLGRSPERGAQRVAAIQAAGGQAAFHAADALDRTSLAEVCSAISDAWGAPSVLVNAAGGNRPDATLPPGSDFCQLSSEAWNGVFDLNLVGGALLPT
ncbi:MAG: SDR family NAD(P)-dependent oxidoreductase, partial [Planctomycetales bacterium]|nr:SDR family NAD(P)-dependent oxidoreductase [Planctomycetales bacterium]